MARALVGAADGLAVPAQPLQQVEQAGGAASTGTQRIMDVQPGKLHQRIGVVLGSTEEVERVERYFAEAG